MVNKEEILRRRTFAIISHPDAGNTTLTRLLAAAGHSDLLSDDRMVVSAHGATLRAQASA